MDRDICLRGKIRIIRIRVGEGRLRCLIAYEYSLHELAELLT